MNLQELTDNRYKIFFDEWLKVDRVMVVNIIGSMKRRCEAVIESHGNHINM